MKLDEKDRALIALLANDARVTNRALAQQVSLSPSACLARVRKLEERRVIVGYRAVIARVGSGRHLEGWADIRFAEPSEELTDLFVALLKSTPEVVEAHRIAGNYDYLIRFCAGDIAAWNDFRDRVSSLGRIAQLRFSILVESLLGPDPRRHIASPAPDRT